MTENIKAITMQPMHSALNDSRPQKEKEVIMDILYMKVKSAILDDPDKYSCSVDIILIHISKH